jgi:maltose O-acetyltransferase
MKIGNNVHVMPGVFFDEAYAFLISIGDNCTITSGVRILAHDASMYRDLGFAKIGKVEIKDNTFIGNNSVILPGVSIGPGAIIGAGSVVNTDVPENSVAAGNPAKVILKKDDFLRKHKENLENSKTFEYGNFFSDINKILTPGGDFKRAYLIGGEKRPNLAWIKRRRWQKSR